MSISFGLSELLCVGGQAYMQPVVLVLSDCAPKDVRVGCVYFKRRVRWECVCFYIDVWEEIDVLMSEQQFLIYLIAVLMSLAKKYVAFQPYRSDLPDFLITIIDQLIKHDENHAFRSPQQQKPIDQLIDYQPEHHELLWLYIDPYGSSHLTTRESHLLFDSKLPNQSHSSMETVTMMSTQGISGGLGQTCNNILANKLLQNQRQNMMKIEQNNLDRIRLRCQANIYTSALDFEFDIKAMFSWSQVYRASSLKSFQYISQMYQKFVTLLYKKDFFRRFYQIKQNDLIKLARYETQFKINTQNWPIIPSSFRQYQEIDRYVSTPAYRAPIINQRLLSKKEAVQCPQNCVCYNQALPEGKQFCKYSLLNGWQSECPNRSRKIECSHFNEQKMNLCRNSEIKKLQRKRCFGKIFSQGQEPQIQERLTWGIDLFTRHVIYYCLPQIEIGENLEKISNEQKKNHFIEHSLTKAMNLIGTLGYSLVDTCNFIKKCANPKKDSLQALSKDMKEQKVGLGQQDQYKGLFSKCDYEYASLLIKNYELASDKSIFRFHTKGKGAICIDKKGIKQGNFIVEYFGQIYEPWRWYDKEDFIKEVLKKKKLKNFIPEFYNIVLEKHVDEPLGYDNLVIDPSRKGNFSSRFSHSCDSNCGTVTTVSEGKYYIGMYSFKNIQYGQELTFDYCSMTESNFQHTNSICLCGMLRCRGYYLQLSNNKIFNNLMDNRNCFFTRNSAILKSAGQVTAQQLDLCAKNNIKQGLLQGTPSWIIKWMARILQFIQYQGQVYKQNLIEQWSKIYPWDNSEAEEQKKKKIQLYSQTNKNDLINIRFQNLITSVDKLKYFFSRNQTNQNPPIIIEESQKVLQILVTKNDSILLELQENLIKQKCELLAQIIQVFIEEIQKFAQISDKLFLFRICALVVSHKLLFMKATTFNNQLLSDIMFFYAFTHTYFGPNNYKPFEADQIIVSLSEILGEKGHPNQKKEKSRKKYSSPFVWGQMASWYKQTIVCPEASLSQDRRGTLSYPLIRSIMLSEYPYEKQSRSEFLKMIQQKPANSWPPAIGCDLSFKNPYKLYGTLLFENIHSQDKLNGKLPCETLLESCLSAIRSNFKAKVQLFRLVQQIMCKHDKQHLMYKIIDRFKIDQNEIPSITHANGFSIQISGQPRKRIKKESEDSI